MHFIGWWSLLLAGVLVAWGWLHAHFWWKRAGWCLGEDAVGYRSGWWTRRESVLRYSKVQSVAQVHNPFDRRHRMRRLVVDSAGAGQSGHRIRIPFLPEADAERLESRLAFEAAHRQFRW